MKHYYISLALAVAVAGTGMAVSVARGGAPIFAEQKSVSGFDQNKNPFTDFARIQQYDPDEPHFWRLAIKDGNIKIEDDFESARDCFLSTFTEDEPDGPWRTCVALDEPSEGFLALYISSRIGRHAGAAAEAQ